MELFLSVKLFGVAVGLVVCAVMMQNCYSGRVQPCSDNVKQDRIVKVHSHSKHLEGHENPDAKDSRNDDGVSGHPKQIVRKQSHLSVHQSMESSGGVNNMENGQSENMELKSETRVIDPVLAITDKGNNDVHESFLQQMALQGNDVMNNMENGQRTPVVKNETAQFENVELNSHVINPVLDIADKGNNGMHESFLERMALQGMEHLEPSLNYVEGSKSGETLVLYPWGLFYQLLDWEPCSYRDNMACTPYIIECDPNAAPTCRLKHKETKKYMAVQATQTAWLEVYKDEADDEADWIFEPLTVKDEYGEIQNKEFPLWALKNKKHKVYRYCPGCNPLQEPSTTFPADFTFAFRDTPLEILNNFEMAQYAFVAKTEVPFAKPVSLPNWADLSWKQKNKAKNAWKAQDSNLQTDCQCANHNWFQRHWLTGFFETSGDLIDEADKDLPLDKEGKLRSEQTCQMILKACGS